MGCNLEPPPPLQHDANAHRGSDHDDGRGRPPVRDHGREDGNAHAGKDRMPLGARRRLHVFTLTPLEHRGLTPWIQFGNRQSVQAAGTGGEVANDEFLAAGIRWEDAAGGDEVAGHLCSARSAAAMLAQQPHSLRRFAQALAVIRDVVKAVAAKGNGLHHRLHSGCGVDGQLQPAQRVPNTGDCGRRLIARQRSGLGTTCPAVSDRSTRGAL